MSNLEDWWESIWDALVAKVIAMTDFDSDTVFYGEKFPPVKFPSAFVCPSITESQPATMHESFWNPTFEIGVVTEDADTKAGKKLAFKLCFKIARTLLTDRHLGDLLQNMECSVITPNWRGLDTGLEQHWVAVTVVCQRKK